VRVDLRLEGLEFGPCGKLAQPLFPDPVAGDGDVALLYLIPEPLVVVDDQADDDGDDAVDDNEQEKKPALVEDGEGIPEDDESRAERAAGQQCNDGERKPDKGRELAVARQHEPGGEARREPDGVREENTRWDEPGHGPVLLREQRNRHADESTGH
jgi:hypothetical protein